MGGIKNQCRSYNPAPSAKTSSINLLATKMSQKNFFSSKYVLALNVKSRLMRTYIHLEHIFHFSSSLLPSQHVKDSIDMQLYRIQK